MKEKYIELFLFHHFQHLLYHLMLHIYIHKDIRHTCNIVPVRNEEYERMKSFQTSFSVLRN
jgi:hypothetical protein